MAITAKDIASIFTGMDLGAEKIAGNFNKLLEENIGQDDQLDTLNNKTLQVGNFIGKDNPDLNNITMGAHNFGFWEDGKVPANSNWPKTMQGNVGWGWILQLGNGTGSKVQLICSTGGWMFMRIYAGTAWDKWTIVQTKYEQ
ncbi:hypothetical protein L2724_06900 [Limosilactobacillus vaginalis]|uniref:Tail fiber protein n=1 Tax=Limosilactobacillus vaginalis TaxID=1633 RepID=A0AAW5WUA2_9LACO|nr:hypothetical protein [Limosilactobacillus vaginalis]MCZ3668007.1 hypothetical protein [Limosilactobacillus vaginalis]